MPFDEELARTPAAAEGDAGEPVNTVFLGPLGLRAGWGLLLYAVLAVVLGGALFWAVSGLGHKPGTEARTDTTASSAPVSKGQSTSAATASAVPFRWQAALLAVAVQVGAVVLAGLGLARVERRRFGVYGLGARGLAKLLPGALCGLAAISLLVGVLRALHLLVFDRERLHGLAVLHYGFAWLAVFALVGLNEEFLFRGYVQFTLMRGLLGLGARLSPAHPRRAAFWLAAVGFSLLFAGVHLFNQGEDPFGIAMVFFAGMLFSYALWQTGSLWWGIGFHLTWDWGQSFLYGVPDSGSVANERLFQTHATGPLWLSGGITGPEGSVLVVPVLLLVFRLIRSLPPSAQPPVEPKDTSPQPSALPRAMIS